MLRKHEMPVIGNRKKGLLSGGAGSESILTAGQKTVCLQKVHEAGVYDSLSNILEINGSSEIGRQFRTEEGSPDLKTGVLLDIFQLSGNFAFFKDRLNSSVSA